VLSAEDNELLTRIEGDAPMGHLMREHYWVPALLSSQLVADGAPVRSRLLGRDHVAFRASDGRIGFFDEACPHRGTSLVLARNEDCALRCIFHGWKIDVSGAVVEVPTHTPNPEAFAAKVPVHHYPTHEAGDIVWVWLGSTQAPPFPELPFTVVPASRRWMSITPSDCNWLQGIDATIDSAHVGTLHSAYIAREPDATVQHATVVLAPRYEVRRTAYGIDATALRPLPDGGQYVRTTNYLMPFIAFTPGNTELTGIVFIVSPVDDTHHNLFYSVWSETLDFNGGTGMPTALASAVGNRPYDPHDFGGFTGDREHNFGQDRAAMAEGHFSGFTGNLLQEDIVTQVSMGPIADRTNEHLSSSDVAIIYARRLLLDSLADMEAGRRLPGTGTDSLAHVIPVNAVVDDSTSWEASAGAPA